MTESKGSNSFYIFQKVHLPKALAWTYITLSVITIVSINSSFDYCFVKTQQPSVFQLFSIGGIGLGSYLWSAIRPWNDLVESAHEGYSKNGTSTSGMAVGQHYKL